ncbi:MAG: PDZ domain-containing protein [Spirochaetaceae bacterium]|nr:PDZ domain-containing protein [Spirochaetaceae bacterium]
MDTLDSLSRSIAALGAASAARLFHVPSPLGGRTALSFDGKYLLVPAVEAAGGESLAILGPGGKELRATVKGFDSRIGLAALELEAPLPEAAWQVAEGLPALGSLLLAAAYPSPEGPELRLDLVRFVGGSGGEEYIQTDGASFPGFSGAALVAPDGKLAGFVASDRPGNRGWAIPAGRAAALASKIAERGFPGRAWLGISTVPIEAPAEYEALLGDGRKVALLVAGLEAEGPAAAAGILVGDLLVSVGGVATASPGELREALDAARPSQALALKLLRAGKVLSLEAMPGRAPAEEGRRGRARGHRGWSWGGCGGMPWGCGPGR